MSPTATIRTSPEDFVVDELPAYAASGRGEHLFVTFRKTGRTTSDAVGTIARALGVAPRDAGFAGTKDRHAVTTQTASFGWPIATPFEEAVARIDAPGIEILGAARHDNKLKPGHLAGNRFIIALRGLAPAEADEVAARLVGYGETGVPNAFGPQRFGRDGDNPERALAWLAGSERGPRDKREQRFLFSALQSLLFNRVLARREAEGTWRDVLPGDLAKKHDSGGLFLVPLEGPDLEDARERARAGVIAPTGPMFGVKMRWPEGAPAALEREVLAEALPDPALLDRWKHLGEGTRRGMVLRVTEVSATFEPAAGSDVASTGVLRVAFVLPKGAYATTVLGRACTLVDAMARPADAEAPGGGGPLDGPGASLHEEDAPPMPDQGRESDTPKGTLSR